MTKNVIINMERFKTLSLYVDVLRTLSCITIIQPLYYIDAAIRIANQETFDHVCDQNEPSHKIQPVLSLVCNNVIYIKKKKIVFRMKSNELLLLLVFKDQSQQKLHSF
jgi:hypothetical protein